MTTSRAVVLAVDFAPRHSAAALLSSDGTLLHHSTLDAGPEADGFLSHVAALEKWATALFSLSQSVAGEVHVVMEDVNHTMTKPAQVLRLQGAFRVLLDQAGFSPPTMVGSSTWQNFFGWRKTEGMTSKGFAGFACAVLGYKIENTHGKQTVDVRDAVLIGRWFIETRSMVI